MPTKENAPTTQNGGDVIKDYTTLHIAEAVGHPKILTFTPEADDPYYTGDAYSQTPLQISQEWETNNTEYPYLAYIKSISNAWPHLRYLADFMEVSTTPLRWKFLRGNEAEKMERVSRTNVVILDFPSTGSPARTTITRVEELQGFLAEKRIGNLVRMIVVEDLSRRVIETLGAKFDIDPSFFREHIGDYSWYNIRDRWMNPPILKAATGKQNWTRLRFVRPRYHKTEDSFQRARQETTRFNILRRSDNDQSQWPVMDDQSIVALTRTKALLWVNTDYGEDHETIGVLLVDPTVKEGYPLWHGYHNWARIPSMYCPTPSPPGPPRTSLLDDVVHWAMVYPWFPSPNNVSPDIRRVLTQPILYLACGEWTIMCEYIKARLGQIEWELGFPEQFHHDMDQSFINQSVKRLHAWRRLIPRCQEMIEEAISNSATFASGMSSVSSSYSTQDVPGDNIIQDFRSVSSQMKELQDRTDRITSVLMAAISIEDSRRGLQENQNLARLTWLATVFIPMTFIAGLFSMQQEISTLKLTFGWYFATAVPVTVLTLGFAMNIHLLPLPRRKVTRGKK